MTEKDPTGSDGVEPRRSSASVDSKTLEAELVTRKTHSRQSSPVKEAKQEQPRRKKTKRTTKRRDSVESGMPVDQLKR